MKKGVLFGLILLVLVGAWIFSDGGVTGNVVSDFSGLEKATFAGGCFWCMEPPFVSSSPNPPMALPPPFIPPASTSS